MSVSTSSRSSRDYNNEAIQKGLHQSFTSQAQAFVRTVEKEIQAIQMQAMESYAHGAEDSDDHSINSSISSTSLLDNNILTDDAKISDMAMKLHLGSSSGSGSGREFNTAAAGAVNVGTVNITNLLNERLSLTESITTLGRHVPNCVMHDLTMQVQGGLHVQASQRNEEPSKLIVPHSQTYTAALLFIDMSGFTKLSLLLDLESLSKVSCLHYFSFFSGELFNTFFVWV